MINLTKGNTEQVYFTGTEKATISDPFFLFVFTNRVTNDVIKYISANDSNNSRYDLVTIIVNDYFYTADEGLWSYEIREKALGNDLAITGEVVEIGYMKLNPTSSFIPTEYTGQINTFKTYGGE